MEETTLRKRSTKKVKPLKDILGEKIFTLPESMANSFDPVIGKKCIFVGVNGKNHYIPVGVPTEIPYAAFCALKDCGILNHYESFEKGKDL